MDPILQAQSILRFIAILTSFALIILILLQVRSGGLGSALGGSNSTEVYRSKRGMDAVLYNATIILTAIFAVSAFVLAAISI